MLATSASCAFPSHLTRWVRLGTSTVSSTQLYTGDPARLATARGSTPPSPAARTPATCAAMGAGGERQPGVGLARVPAEVRSRRRAPQQGPKPHRIRTLGDQQRCAAISACERSARRAGQLTRTCRWQPIGTLRRVCTNARGLNAREPRPRQSGGGARTVRQSMQTSRPDGKHAAQPRGHACARLGAGGSGMRRLKIRGISGRATARGLSVRPLAALGYHTGTFGPLPGAPEGRRTQT